MSKPFERKFNAGALLLAAVAAPPISLWLFLVVAAVVEGGFFDQSWALLPQMLFVTLTITVWGVIPAGAFGGLGLLAFERLRAGRWPAGWVFAASGAGAASTYVAVGLALGAWAPAAAVLVAPWATALNYGRNEIPPTAMEPAEWAGVIAAIVVAGALAGLIYRRACEPRIVERVRPALNLDGDVDARPQTPTTPAKPPPI